MQEYNFKVNGTDYNAKIEQKENGTLDVNLNGKSFTIEIPVKAAAVRPIVKHVAAPAAVSTPEPKVLQKAGPASVTSPLPGTVTEVKVEVGQKVKKGDVLLVMEAMKMANDIVAENDGTVKEICVKKGDNINQGDILINMENEAVVSAPAPSQPVSTEPAPVATPGAATVTAPLPGTITEIKATVGQRVKAGDVLLVMEAMKMANDIVAESNGTVKAILVAQGAQVQSGDVLVEMA